MEIWRPYQDTPYEVSDAGRVRRSGRILVQSIASNGYPMLSLSVGGKVHGMLVHRMVCRTFHGEPEGRIVRHKDNNRANPRADNLQWGTRAENEADKIGHGTQSRGEKHHMSRLSDAQVSDLRLRAEVRGKEPGATRKFIEREIQNLGVSYGCIEDIIYGRRRS